MKQINQAIDKKISIVDQAYARAVNDYYYNETVWVKHKPEIGFGIKDNPYYTTHQELKFNSGNYYQSLSDVNAEIEQYLSEINQLTDTLVSFKSKEQELKQHQDEHTNLEQLLKSTKDQLKYIKAQFTSYIHGLTDVQRACLLASEFNTKGAEFLIETICEKSFDANILATIAIEQGDMQKLTFAINAGSDTDAYCIEDKTLVQYAIAKGDQSIISKVISSTSNFDNSLLFALKHNDLGTIKVILSTYPKLALHLLSGEASLLHYAIANKQMEIIDYIVNKHPEALKVFNCNGDSPIDVAARSGNEELLSYISKHSNIDHENDKLSGVDSHYSMQMIFSELEVDIHQDNIYVIKTSGSLDDGVIDEI